MKINRMASENSVPDWFEKSASDLADKSDTTSVEDIKRISLLPADQVTDEILVREKDQIEACVSNSSLYHYRSSWSNEVKSGLREYAMAIGMKMEKFQAVSDDHVDVLVASANQRENEIRQVTASRETTEEPRLVVDAFKLDEKALTPHMDKSEWETVEKQSEMGRVSGELSMMSNVVTPIGGGENYYENSDVDPARGQNSITNPNAIEEYAESDVEDTGARLRRENEEKTAKRASDHNEWEQDKIDAMSASLMTDRRIFPTEVMNAQPGLNTPSSQMGVYSKFDAASIPDKTEGEMISEQNEQRRKSIQGEDSEEREFKISKASVRSISDDFGEELKKYLK